MCTLSPREKVDLRFYDLLSLLPAWCLVCVARGCKPPDKLNTCWFYCACSEKKKHTEIRKHGSGKRKVRAISEVVRRKVRVKEEKGTMEDNREGGERIWGGWGRKMKGGVILQGKEIRG